VTAGDVEGKGEEIIKQVTLRHTATGVPEGEMNRKKREATP
jgi:hypothetical protein